jgi:integrase
MKGNLTALKVTRIRELGMHADGGGLFLQVTRGGRSWVYRYMIAGKTREMGLGSATTITLAEARNRRDDARRLRNQGVDPIEQRRSERAKALLDAAKAMTFRQAASDYVETHEAAWRNAKHRAQWTSTLETYAFPVFGKVSVQCVNTALVLKALEPIWAIKPETASRVRGRVEVILDWAKVRGFREGENPARWRGHLAMILPPRSKVRKVVHHASLPFQEIGAFITDLRARESIAARALEFAILTAARTGEVLGARWSEIDIDARTWTVPEGRMKAGRQHRVSLSHAAIFVLNHMLQHRRDDDFLFPGLRRGKPLSNMALLAALRRMKRKDLTTHGFRATFKTWAAERTNFAREVVEAALAHATGDKVEAAYQRGDLFDKRQKLMDAWAQFCTKGPVSAEVVPMKINFGRS